MIDIKETFNVVMLPANEFASRIHNSIKGNQLVCFKETVLLPNSLTQNIYFTSNGEIQEGDWVYCKDHNLISKVIQIINGSMRDIVLENMPHNGTFDSRQLQKIVATTDKSIYRERCDFCNGIGDISSSGDDKDCPVCKGEGAKVRPQIPESFIQYYIQSYNEGKAINTVDLKVRFETYGYGTILVKEVRELVLNQDNTVVIYEPKLYTESEVRDIVIDKIAEFSAHRDAVRKYTKSDVEGFVREVYYKATGRSTGSPDGFCDKWIKDNL